MMMTFFFSTLLCFYHILIKHVGSLTQASHTHALHSNWYLLIYKCAELFQFRDENGLIYTEVHTTSSPQGVRKRRDGNISTTYAQVGKNQFENVWFKEII